MVLLLDYFVPPQCKNSLNFAHYSYNGGSTAKVFILLVMWVIFVIHILVLTGSGVGRDRSLTALVQWTLSARGSVYNITELQVGLLRHPWCIPCSGWKHFALSLICSWISFQSENHCAIRRYYKISNSGFLANHLNGFNFLLFSLVIKYFLLWWCLKEVNQLRATWLTSRQT